MDILKEITKLSHQFGTKDYVRGGGGNTSAKDNTTLWVKPSGTTLGGLTSESFIAMDRTKLSELYEVTPPSSSAQREAMVSEMMAASVIPGNSGRASVEAPLHNSFDATFVVHTHPALVNGMTCGQEWKKVCQELFPQALGIDYTDPGYTLCMKVREEIELYTQKNGHQPSVIFLENHGVFVAGNSAEEINKIYTGIMKRLAEAYKEVGVSVDFQPAPESAPQAVNDHQRLIKEILGSEASCISYSGPFSVAQGPVSPDHIVYSKSFSFIGEPSAEAIEEFIKTHGYPPKVISCSTGVFGVGASQKQADLALELAQDGAMIKQLAEAFGGIKYLNDDARNFIENWEAETYRQSQT